MTDKTTALFNRRAAYSVKPILLPKFNPHVKQQSERGHKHLFQSFSYCRKDLLALALSVLFMVVYCPKLT
jgi:hypothetical protein